MKGMNLEKEMAVHCGKVTDSMETLETLCCEKASSAATSPAKSYTNWTFPSPLCNLRAHFVDCAATNSFPFVLPFNEANKVEGIFYASYREGKPL